jgi:hypothetical protein
MKRLLCAVVLCCFCSSLFADQLLIINADRDVYVIDTSTGKRSDVPFDAIYMDGDLIEKPKPGPGPNPPKPGPADPVVKKIVDLSKLHLKGEADARALIAVSDQFRKLIEAGTIEPKDLEQILGMAIRRMKKELGNDAVEDWFDGVLALAGEAGPTPAFLQKVIEGLESAFGVNAPAYLATVNAGISKVRTGFSEQQAAAAVVTETEEAADIASILLIIEMIMKIINIIKGLGCLEMLDAIDNQFELVWLARHEDVVREAVVS